MQYHNTKQGDDNQKSRYPKLSLAKIYRYRRRLEAVLDKYVKQVPVGATLDSLCAEVVGVLAGKTCNLPATAQPCGGTVQTIKDHAAGMFISKQLADYLAVRLAGNYSFLKGGGVLPRYIGLPRDEWAYVSIKSVSAVTREGTRDQVRFDFTVLTGTAAGECISQMVPVSLFGGLAKRLGLVRGRKEWAAPHQRMFVGCRLLGLLVFQERDDALRISKYIERPITTKINRVLLKARTVDRRCPHKYTWSCTHCPLGVTSCRIATQPQDYPKRVCPSCNTYSWYLPMQRPGGPCLICKNKTRNNVTAKSTNKFGPSAVVQP